MSSDEMKGGKVHIERLYVAAGGTGLQTNGSGQPGPVTTSLTDERRRVLENERDTVRKRLARLRAAGEETAALQAHLLAIKRELLLPGTPLEGGDDLADGRYVLKYKLGYGGIGTVWLAEDSWENDKYVAVKVLHGEHSGESIVQARFERGAREMARLKTEGVVQVLAPVARERGWSFYVMEYVSGGDLSIARLRGEIARDTSLRHVANVAMALSEAHAQGTIHRDVSPTNILISERGSLLTDFDLVHVADSTAATKTGFLGKIVYSAPETHEHGFRADHRADIYSLGISALFCAAGVVLPLSVFSDAESYLRSLKLERPLSKAIGRAIARDPAGRYEDAKEFAVTLSAALSAPASHDRSLALHRILVVDDEVVIREILADFLSMEGFWVRTAADGSEALSEHSRNDFDAVLLDLKMPVMGGMECLKQLRSRYPRVPVILMTGFGTVETAVDAMKLGAYDYIQKPFKVEEVVHTLRRALEHAGSFSLVSR